MKATRKYWGTVCIYLRHLTEASSRALQHAASWRLSRWVTGYVYVITVDADSVSAHLFLIDIRSDSYTGLRTWVDCLQLPKLSCSSLLFPSTTSPVDKMYVNTGSNPDECNLLSLQKHAKCIKITEARQCDILTICASKNIVLFWGVFLPKGDILTSCRVSNYVVNFGFFLPTGDKAIFYTWQPQLKCARKARQRDFDIVAISPLSVKCAHVVNELI